MIIKGLFKFNFILKIKSKINFLIHMDLKLIPVLKFNPKG